MKTNNSNRVNAIYLSNEFKTAQKRSKKLHDFPQDLIEADMRTREFQTFVQLVIREADVLFAGYGCNKEVA